MSKVYSIEEAKEVLGLQTKAANDVEHTGNTGKGKELIPSEEFANTVFEEIVNSSALLSSLPGNHGSSLPANLVVPIIGEAGFFDNAVEYTDTAATLDYNIEQLPTAQVKLKREKLIMTIAVSDEMLMGGVDIEKYVRAGIAQSGARTNEAVVLSADDATGTGNINSKGVSVSAGDKRYWFREGGSLRKTGIANTIVDVGALTATDLFDIQAKLGSKGTVASDCLFVTNRQTASKISQIPELVNAYQSGRISTLVKGMETNILGSDIYLARDLPLTDATGAVDAQTPANNTKGSILYFNKSAVQFGFTDLRIEPKRIEGYGWHFVCTYYLAHAIVNKKAGQTDPSVVLGANVTV